MLVASACWLDRGTLHAWTASNPAGVPAVLAGLPVMLGAMGGAWWLEHKAIERAWRRRTAARAGLATLVEPPKWLGRFRRRADPLAWLCRPMFASSWGRTFSKRWNVAGFEADPSRFVLLVLAAAAVGWIIGARIAGPILAAAMAASAPLLPASWVEFEGCSQTANLRRPDTHCSGWTGFWPCSRAFVPTSHWLLFRRVAASHFVCAHSDGHTSEARVLG